VRVVAAGDALLAPSVTRRLISRFATKPPDPLSPDPQSSGPQPPDSPSTADVLAGLTDRQQEVLLLVAEGLSNAEIAARLYITPGTAKIHVAHLLAKLGARDRIQLVILAYRSGLVTAPLADDGAGDRQSAGASAGASPVRPNTGSDSTRYSTKPVPSPTAQL
jgi:DNA-binding NarL/FixJ family response regulator